MAALRVLIVDDSATIVSQLGRVLDDVLPGAEVYAAPDVASARALFERHQPNVVFLDIMLGGGPNGHALLPSFARATWETHAIVTTALARDHPDVVAMFSHGAFGYVRKPVRRADILAALQELEIETGHEAGDQGQGTGSVQQEPRNSPSSQSSRHPSSGPP